PVAHVDDVDVLLDHDVTGQLAIPDPVSESELVGRPDGTRWPIELRTVVKSFAARYRADGAVPQALCKCQHRRRHPDLEPHVEADLPVDLLPELDNVPGAGHVNRDRLLAVRMSASSEHGLEMLDVVIGRRRDLDEVHLLRVGNPL